MEAQTLSEADTVKFIPIIDDILINNLATVSVRGVRNELAARTGIDFKLLKKEINALIITRFDKILVEHQEAEPRSSPAAQTKAEDGASSPESGSDDTTNTKKRKSSAVEDEDARLAAELHAALNSGRPTRTKAKVTKKVAPKKKRKVKSKATVDSDESGNEGGDGGEKKKKKRGGNNPNNAFNRPLVLAPKLAELVGEAEMSRPKVVKEIWNYVKAHDLQDPNDKRYIICDDKLKPIFGDKVHMFTMNKVLSGFMYKPEEIAGGATKSEQPSGNGTPMMDMLSPVKSEGSSEDGSGSVAGSMSSSMPMIFKEEDIHA